MATLIHYEIPIEPINKTQYPKPKTLLDINLSQNASIAKQLIDTTSKKEKPTANDKKWFVFTSKGTK